MELDPATNTCAHDLNSLTLMRPPRGPVKDAMGDAEATAGKDPVTPAVASRANTRTRIRALAQP